MKTRCLPVSVFCLAVFSLPVRADDWPQWRGPDRSNVSREKGLLKEWPKAGPRLLWTYRDAGIGFSGPAVVGNRLYTMGARGETEYVLALDVETGKEVWHARVGPIFTFPGNSYGDGPRSTPTVDGDLLYALGGMGDLVCLEAAGGKERWRVNLIKDLGGSESNTAGSPEKIGWGFSESPLVEGNLLICTPGGKQGTVAALDKKKGTVVWRSTGLKDEATYASLVPATIGGVKQYVVLTYRGNQGGAVVGVGAKDGKVLWEFPQERWAGVTAIVPTPIVQKDHVYVSVSSGCDLLKISKAGSKFRAKQEYKATARRVMKNDIGGVLLFADHVYGYSRSVGWVCQDFLKGTAAWKNKNKLTAGSLTCAGGQLYLFSDEGTAVLLAANPQDWKEKGRFNLPEQSKLKETRKGNSAAKLWTPPVVANGRLYLRDQELLFCYEVGAKK